MLIFICSLISFAIGLRSGVYKDQLFQTVLEIKYFLVKLKSEVLEQFNLNEFAQLTWYHGKIEVSNPNLTDKTLVAFVFWQSNYANHGGERYISKDEHVLNYFDRKFYIATAPLLGATGLSGNVWTNLGNKIVQEKLFDNVILIPAEVGGISVKEWQDGGRLNRMLKERLKDAKESKLNATYFLWHQGENDNSLSGKQYLDGINNVIDLTKVYFPESKFLIPQASRCGLMPSSHEILNAQFQATQREGGLSDQILTI